MSRPRKTSESVDLHGDWGRVKPNASAGAGPWSRPNWAMASRLRMPAIRPTTAKPRTAGSGCRRPKGERGSGTEAKASHNDVAASIALREHGIAAETKRKFRCMTDSNHVRLVAENVVDRQFEPEAPNRVWTADVTSIPTREGWLYPAAVEDLHSRRIVGWSMGERIDSRLVVDALESAVSGRLPDAGLVAHSDRGSQYASEHYQRPLAGRGITRSMSRRANCWDDAPMESFFATLKKELVHDEDYATREEARASIFEFIEVFDSNRVRRHSALGYRSPVEYERAGQPLIPRSPFVGKSSHNKSWGSPVITNTGPPTVRILGPARWASYVLYNDPRLCFRTSP